MPACLHGTQQGMMRRMGQVGIGSEEGEGGLPCLFEPEAMMQQVADLELRQAGLLGPEQFSWAANLEILLGNIETVSAFLHHT